jgi:hypothetical protein
MMRIGSSRIVGAMTLPHGKAAFDSANVIVESTTSPGTYLQVRAYVSPDEIEGKALDRADFEALIQAEQAIALDPHRETALGATFWVLRPTFIGREEPLAELRASGWLLHDFISLPDGSWGCLVREPEASKLRDRWAEKAFREALSWAESGRWEWARAAASRAFVLERTLSADRIALLSLTHERCGNNARAKAYLQMARNSRGEELAKQAFERRSELERRIDESAPPSGTRPAHASAIRAWNDNAVHAGLRRLRRSR